MKRLRHVPLMLVGLGVAIVVHGVELYAWHAHKQSIYGRRA